MVFAGAGRADDGDRAARFDRQRQILDQRLLRVVAERHMLQLHPPAQLLRTFGGRRVGLLLRRVQHLEDPLGRGHARLHQVRHRRDLRQRHRELPRVLDERLHVPDGQRPGRHPQPADDRHQHVVEIRHEHHQRLHHTAVELRPEPRLVQRLVLLGELPRRLLLPPEHLHQGVPGVHLLDVRVERARGAPLLHEVRLRPLADLGGDHERQRHRHQRDERQDPGDVEHHRQHADDGEQ